jgi:hypothetical protein
MSSINTTNISQHGVSESLMYLKSLGTDNLIFQRKGCAATELRLILNMLP